MITMQRGKKRHSLNKWTHVCKCRKRASVSPLKASADGGILGSLNHGMQLLRKFQRCSSHKACWLLSNPVQYDRTLDLKTSHAAISTLTSTSKQQYKVKGMITLNSHINFPNQTCLRGGEEEGDTYRTTQPRRRNTYTSLTQSETLTRHTHQWHSKTLTRHTHQWHIQKHQTYTAKTQSETLTAYIYTSKVQSETLTRHTCQRYSQECRYTFTSKVSHKHLPDIQVRDTVKNVDTLSHPRYSQKHLPNICIDTVKNVDTVSHPRQTETLTRRTHPRYGQKHLPDILPDIHIRDTVTNVNTVLHPRHLPDIHIKTVRNTYQTYTSEIQSRM